MGNKKDTIVEEVKQEEQKAITPVTSPQPAIVMPVVSPEEAVKSWNAYQQLKKAIATPDDVQVIRGKEFYKKSYWRKIATFFNLSVEITNEKVEEIGTNNIVYHFTQKAIAPNGRYAFGVGSCDLLEKTTRNTLHNTRGTAETRAFNRAVSNLVGGGEVSAEEITEVHDDHPMTPRQMADSKEQSQSGNGNGYKVTEKQMNFIKKLLDEKGYSLEQLYKRYEVSDLAELTGDQASTIIGNLMKLPKREVEPTVDPDEADEEISAMASQAARESRDHDATHDDE